ncbi:hypothetical protein CQA40_10675 [Helicobacter sp. MIT 01-3238]|nr:hypothetical protein CQA40_10675 [Helicobacter sp. MIT 01-3238]
MYFFFKIYFLLSAFFFFFFFFFFGVCQIAQIHLIPYICTDFVLRFVKIYKNFTPLKEYLRNICLSFIYFFI